MGAAENYRKHDDLDVGAMGFMTLWPTKKHLANTDERIHMWVTRCKSNANGKTSRRVSISKEVSTDDDSRSPQYVPLRHLHWLGHPGSIQG